MRTAVFAILAACTLAACGLSDEHFQQSVDSANVAITDGGDAPIVDAVPVDAPSPAMLAVTQPAGAIAFGDVVIGQTSPMTTVTVANTSDSPSGVVELAFEDTIGFAIVGGNDGCSGQAVAAHHTCMFALDFAPPAAGSAATTLHVNASPGGDLSVAVSATGITQGQIDIMEGSADFGTVDVDAAAATKTFTVRNLGQSPIGMPIATAGGAAAYSVQATTCTSALQSADTCTVTVAFDPSTVGTVAGSLTVTSTPGGQDVAALGGTGTATVTVVLAGGGSGSVSSTQAGIDCGSACTATFSSSPLGLQASPTLGSTFTSWSGDCSGAGTCSLDLTGTKSVTATFDIEHFALNLAQTGTGSGTIAQVAIPNTIVGTSCGVGCTSYPYATKVTLTAAPKTGSTFTSWSGDCNGTGACVVTLDQIRNVTATFTLDSFTLTVTDGGSGSGVVTSSVGAINCGTACGATYDDNSTVTLTATAATGSTFASWSGCTSTSGTSCTVTMTADTNVTATFTAGSYALTLTTTGTGAVTSGDGLLNCPGTCAKSYTYNATVALTATAGTGYHFDHWVGGSCDASTATTCTITMPAAAVSTQAIFTITSEALTVTIAGTGSGTVMFNPSAVICPANCTQAYPYNTSVTLLASPATGSTTSWTGCDSSTGNSCTIAMTGVKAVTATFSAGPQTLTVALAGNGTGSVASTPIGLACGTTCSAAFTYATSVTLTPTATGGSSFAGWSGPDCSGTGACIVAMTQARNVTATFSAGNQTLTLTQFGSGGTLSITPSTGCTTSGQITTCSVPYNTSLVVTQSAGANNTFTGWSGACTGTGATCTLAMTSTLALTGTFALVNHQLQLAIAGGGGGTIARNPPGTPCATGTQCFVYPAGTSVVLTETPDGSSTFSNWSTCGGASTCTVVVSADSTETATFLPNYTLTVSDTGTGSGTVTAGGQINCTLGLTGGCQASFVTGQMVTLDATVSGGTQFVGWGGACASSGSSPICNLTMSAAASVTATFVGSYTVMATTSFGTIAFAGGTLSCGAGCEVYLNGSTATLTATPNSGYVFTGWGGQCAGQIGATCSFSVTGNDAVTATFAPQYNLGVSIVGSGSITSSDGNISCGVMCNSTYTTGATVTLTANPGVGTVFAGWSGDCTGSSTCTVAITQARNVTATFYYDLNMNTLGAPGTIIGGSVGALPCPVMGGFTSCLAYAPNAVVPVTEVPGVGASFTTWSGGCSGAGTCSMTMFAARTVTANFAVNSYTVTVNLASNNTFGDNAVTDNLGGMSCGGTICSGTYRYNTAVTLTAVPDSATGVFTAWMAGPCAGSSNPVCTFAVPAAAVTMTAQFDWFATMTILPNAGITTAGVNSNVASEVTSSNGAISCTNTTTLTGTCVAHPVRGSTMQLSYTGVSGWGFACGIFGMSGTFTTQGSGSCDPSTCTTSSCTCSVTFTNPGAYTSGENVGCAP